MQGHSFNNPAQPNKTINRFDKKMAEEYYEFNPFEGANHSKKSHLGEPGTPTLIISSITEDPKYDGPCGPSYHRYRNCLLNR